MWYTSFMNKFFLLITVILFSFSIFSQEGLDRKIVFDERVYDPFFAATIRDNEGEKFNVSRLAYFDEYNEKKFFFWVRRNSGLYDLSFKNIKSINFEAEDFADDKYEGFTRGTLLLVSGETHTVYVKSTGQIEGYDEIFGSPVTFYMNYNLIEQIEFRHDGDYKICPFCNTIYFDSEQTECVYDKTPLVEGVISISEK